MKMKQIMAGVLMMAMSATAYADPAEGATLDDYAGSYTWEHIELCFGFEVSRELTIAVTDYDTGEVTISGTSEPNFTFTIKGYLDLEAGALFIYPFQNLGEDKYGDVQYFYFKDDIDDNGPSETLKCSVGEISGYRIQFPLYDIWAIGDPEEEEVGYWMLAYCNQLAKKVAPVDMAQYTWREYSTALFEDGWLTPPYGKPSETPWAVTVEQAEENPALLRIASPYLADGSRFESQEGYIVLSISNPDCVEVLPHVFSGYTHLGYKLQMFNMEGFLVDLGYDRKTMERKGLVTDFSTYDEAEKLITIRNCRYNMEGNERYAYSWQSDSGEDLAPQMVSTLKLDYDPMSVTGVEATYEAPVEYYNLQGVRVDNPSGGVFIRRNGQTTSKIYIK